MPLDTTPRRLAMHWKIIIGLVAGVVVGLVINRFRADILESAGESGALASAIAFVVEANWLVGQVFLQGLRFIAVPIVLFSLVVGVASLGDLRKVGRIGGKTILIYTVTTAVAVTIGLVLANAVRPGRFVGDELRDQLVAQRESEVASRTAARESLPTIAEQIRDLIPANPFAALADAQMLQVIVAALAVGIGLTMIPREKASLVTGVCDAMTDAIVGIVHLVMRLAPVAVFVLIVDQVAKLGLSVLAALGAYCLTLVCGLAIVLFLEYPLLLRVFAGIGPARYFRAIAPAQLLAFSTSSSSATLPVTMDCVQNRLGVSERITSFVCPLGATVNMDGTAMYQGLATAFIAQMFHHDLSLAQQLTIVLTATLASIGTPGIPGAGVVMLIIVLESVGMPPAGIGVILGVDRLMDMCRTVVNVSGDAMTAAIVARSEGEAITPPAS
jgi:Na+/H+-dicarboxylate symporter